MAVQSRRKKKKLGVGEKRKVHASVRLRPPYGVRSIPSIALGKDVLG